MKNTVQLRKGFATKMAVTALVVGILVSLTMPLTYLIVEKGNVELKAKAFGSEIAEELSELIRTNRNTWKYSQATFDGLFAQHRLFQEQVVTVEIFDNQGQLIATSGKFESGNLIKPLYGDAPITFNNKFYGYVHVGMSSKNLFDQTMIALGTTFSVAVALSIFLYKYPVAIVGEAETQINTLINKLLNITSSLGEGVYVLNEEGVITFVNPETARLLGWDEELLIGKHISDVIYYRKAEGKLETGEDHPLLKTVVTGLSYHCDQDFFVRKDGVMFPVAYVSTPFIEAGKLGSVTVFHDISERRQAERALRESEERYRDLFENANDLIISTDPEGNILYANRAWMEALGYSAEEVTHQKLFEVLDEYNRPQLQKLLGQIAYEQTVSGVEFVLLTKDGRKINVEGNLSFRWDDGTLGSTREPGAVRAIFRDISERKQAEEKITHLAYFDSLTGLPNRVQFKEKLNQALRQALHKNQMLAVIFLDLDGFKKINDTLGHSEGDRLLQLVANRLTSCLRGDDIVARQGGDEFTLLLTHLNSVAEAAEVAKRILEALGWPFQLKDQDYQISASIGVSVFPKDGKDAETLLKHSDAAMFSAKEAGRATYRVYDPALNQKLLKRIEMERSLRRAIEYKELEVWYQPIVDARSGKIVSTEALVRWRHPELGIILPVDFIPLAEENGAILPIGEQVLETACIQNTLWQMAGHPDLRVSVNLSARQFQQKNLLDMVTGVLEKAGLKPEFLELEITESVAMKNVEHTIAMVRELKQMGVRISIDDFGTGFASLSYLKLFQPIDTLKIDRSFVHDLAIRSQNAEALVATMIVLAKNLKLKVVAEGVECRAQLDFLREHNCDEIQGTLCSEPLEPTQVEALLNRHFDI